jgi:hypothetical protein
MLAFTAFIFSLCVGLMFVPLPQALRVGRHAKGYRW